VRVHRGRALHMASKGRFEWRETFDLHG
jgi:hypothetical protein